MLPRVSLAVVVLVAMPIAAFAQSDKPSPVPSRVRKQERARALDAVQPSASNQMASTWNPQPSSDGNTHRLPPQPVHWDGPQTGSSVYFSGNVRGKASASGEILNPEELIAAHASLPFGTLVKVTNIKNGKEVTVRIVDRISSSSSHVISVSEKAAVDLDFRRAGIGSVRIMPVQNP